jgi:hypothetical protein
MKSKFAHLPQPEQPRRRILDECPGLPPEVEVAGIVYAVRQRLAEHSTGAEIFRRHIAQWLGLPLATDAAVVLGAVTARLANPTAKGVSP